MPTNERPGLRRGAAVTVWTAAPLAVLLACSAQSTEPDQSAPRAVGLQVPSSRATEPARSELSHALRARVVQLPAFARLPASDQAWVLAKASATIKDANARELEPLVQQLAEVRQFAVSEREEPLPARSFDPTEAR